MVPGTKVAVTDALPPAKDTVQGANPEHPPPDQPENTYPSEGVALSTAAFWNRAAQLPVGTGDQPGTVGNGTVARYRNRERIGGNDAADIHGIDSGASGIAVVRTARITLAGLARGGRHVAGVGH